MKKFLYVVGLAFIILFYSYGVSAANEVYYINNHGIEMTEQEYNNLVQLGFTQREIEVMRRNVFEENKDIEGELVSTTTKYIKTTMSIRNGIRIFTQQEFPTRIAIVSDMQLNARQQPGFSPNVYGDYYDGLSMDTYRVITSDITNINNTTMRYKASMEFLNTPSERSNDILAVGIESTKVTRTTDSYFEQNWRSNNLDDWNDVCAPKYQSTGVSAVYQLPTGSVSQLEAFIYFNVTKLNPNQTLSSITAVGTHAHAIETVDLDDIYDNYTADILGIYVYPPYDDSYSISPTAQAYFIGEW